MSQASKCVVRTKVGNNIDKVTGGGALVTEHGCSREGCLAVGTLNRGLDSETRGSAARNSQCTGPGVGASLDVFRSALEVTVASAKGILQGKMVGSGARKVALKSVWGPSRIS